MHTATRLDGVFALILLAIGLTLRNCVFVGAAALLAISCFYRHMDGLIPAQPIRAALRCIAAGTAFIAVSVAMGLVLLTGTFGFWPPVDSIALVAGGLLATITMAIRATIPAPRGGDSEPVPTELLIVATAVAALGLAANGAGWIACLYAGAAFAVAATVGWHLAGETASALLRSGAER